MDRRRSPQQQKKQCQDPSIYFSLVVSSVVDPNKIIEGCAHKWTHNGGLRIIIKDLQDIQDKDNMEVNNNHKEQSPVKKRRGSSKSSTKEANCTPHKVCPPENQAQGEVAPSILKKPSSLTCSSTHSRGSYLNWQSHLTKSTPLTYLQRRSRHYLQCKDTGSKVCCKPNNPTMNEKGIAMKGDISPNMTKLGLHVKISGNGNKLNKQKIWDNGKGKKSSTTKGAVPKPIHLFLSG
jgi:hypothetical protein